MVAIYRVAFGLQLEAVSDSFESAVKALYDRYAKYYEKGYSPLDWWYKNKKEYCGAPNCYEIKEIEKW